MGMLVHAEPRLGLRHRPVLCLDGDKWKVRSSYTPRKRGGAGWGVAEEIAYTLNTTDRHFINQPKGIKLQ